MGPGGHSVARVQREKVLKIDRPFRAGGFLSLTGPLGPRVVVSPYRAMLIKSALRDDLAVPYGMISILQWKTIQPRLRSEVGLFSLGRKPGCKGLIIRGRLL